MVDVDELIYRLWPAVVVVDWEIKKNKALLSLVVAVDCLRCLLFFDSKGEEKNKGFKYPLTCRRHVLGSGLKVLDLSTIKRDDPQ